MLANGFEISRLPARRWVRVQPTACSQTASRESKLHGRKWLQGTTRRCGSGKRFHTHAEAFSLPFVIFAQLGMVLLHLRFQFAERFLPTGSDFASGAGDMHRSHSPPYVPHSPLLLLHQL